MKGTTRIFLASAVVILATFRVECQITLSASNWTPIGPARPDSGRIDVAAPDPADTNVMYVGAHIGGIWKTTDWSDAPPVWTEVTNLPQILSLAVHEHDLVVFPATNTTATIVLAAASGPGGGVLRSCDAGNSWSYLANSHFDLAEFGAIVVDPNVANAQTVYVAISAGSTDFISGSGLYKSTDGGTTWADAGSGTFSGFVSDLLEIQENGKTVLYAADTANGQANKGGIYRSPDGGATWTATNLPTNANGFFSFRLAGSTTPTEEIYVAAIDNSEPNNLHGVITRYVTSDQGSDWTPLTWPDAPGSAQWHRYRHNLIAVDPADSNTVYVNADLENNLVHPGEWIYKSGDGGKTWQALANGGGDPVSATFDDTGAFISTGDVGVFRLNAGNGLDQKCGNLNTTEFYSFSLDPSNTRTAYGIAQDGPGTLQYSGSVWQYRQPTDAGQGESGKIRVDPKNSNRVYYLDNGTADCVSNPTSAARFVHSDDGGSGNWAGSGNGAGSGNWQPAITGLPTIMQTASSCSITDFSSYPGKGSIVIDPNNSKRLLIAIHNSVFETQTGGDPNAALPFGNNGWRDIGTNLGLSGWISKIALAPSDSNTIFVGTEDGRVFKTTTAGYDCPNCPTWTEVDSGLPQQNQRIMDLQISPTNSDYDFAVTSPFMYRDDNAPNFSGFFHVWMRNGGAWSPINGNLPKELGGETITVNWSPVTPGRTCTSGSPVLYVGTLRGVFGSTDLGSTWTRFDSVPRTRVTDLDFVPSLNLIGAGTIGWGAWEILTSSNSQTNTKSKFPVLCLQPTICSGYNASCHFPTAVCGISCAFPVVSWHLPVNGGIDPLLEETSVYISRVTGEQSQRLAADLQVAVNAEPATQQISGGSTLAELADAHGRLRLYSVDIVGPSVEISDRSGAARPLQRLTSSARAPIIVVSVSFNAATIAPGTRLRLVRYDTRSGRWLDVRDQSENVSRHLITARVSTIGKFTVVAEVGAANR